MSAGRWQEKRYGRMFWRYYEAALMANRGNGGDAYASSFGISRRGRAGLRELRHRWGVDDALGALADRLATIQGRRFDHKGRRVPLR